MCARSRTLPAVLCLAGALLSACGGGDDTPDRTQTAIGTITAFGSVVVNGVRFDDSAASVTIDDAAVARDRLRVGMVVQVRGQIRSDGTGVARSIRHATCVRGPITAMNRVRNTVTVLGQTVEFDDGTVFDGVTLRDINAFAIGDHVDVSCLPDPARERLRATRMERLGVFQNGSADLAVEGPVAKLDRNARTFEIGGLTVAFAGLASDAVPAGLANGMTVRAQGSRFAGATLTADRLRDRDRDRITLHDGDGLEVEGCVADFVSLADFRVAGQAVDASDAEIRNGTAADIADGVRVEAEGTITDGVLVARRLVIRRQSNVRVEAGLQSRSVSAGTLTLLGRAILVNEDTELRDRQTSAGRPLAVALADLETADRLEVNAYADATGALVATRVERTAPDPLVVVKGPADAKVPTTGLTLSGFAVATGAATRYRDADRVLVDATTFYGAVAVPPAVPSRVHARGVVADLATSVVDATRGASTVGEVEIVGP